MSVTYVQECMHAIIVEEASERLSGDLDSNGVVNIVDVSIVAKAFGASPEDPGWNATADIDKNGTINIVDVAQVAADFGKTV